MGRKSKNKKGNVPNGASTSSDGNKQLSKSVKKEIMDNVKALLDRCSQPANTGPKEYEDYLEIRELVEKITSLQKGKKVWQFPEQLLTDPLLNAFENIVGKGEIVR